MSRLNHTKKAPFASWIVALLGLAFALGVVVMLVAPFYNTPPTFREAKRRLNAIRIVLPSLLSEERESLPLTRAVTLGGETVLCPECDSPFLWQQAVNKEKGLPSGRLASTVLERVPVVACEGKHRDGTRWALFSDGTIERRQVNLQ